VVDRYSRGDLVIKNCWLGLTLLSVPQLVFGLADGSGDPSLTFSLARSPARARQRGVESVAFAQSVAIFPKPLPSAGVRVFQRVQTLATERDGGFVPVELE
jgi:hypothetical protein